MGWTKMGTSAAEAALFEGLPEIVSLPSSSGASLYREVSRAASVLLHHKQRRNYAALALYSCLSIRELPGSMNLHQQSLRFVPTACSAPQSGSSMQHICSWCCVDKGGRHLRCSPPFTDTASFVGCRKVVNPGRWCAQTAMATAIPAAPSRRPRRRGTRRLVACPSTSQERRSSTAGHRRGTGRSKRHVPAESCHVLLRGRQGAGSDWAVALPGPEAGPLLLQGGHTEAPRNPIVGHLMAACTKSAASPQASSPA